MQKCHKLIHFCGVGAHHQNGSIEQCIVKITTRARVTLLHAKRYWPEAIKSIFWHFAVAEAINMENQLPIDEHGRTPLQRLTAMDAHLGMSCARS